VPAINPDTGLTPWRRVDLIRLEVELSRVRTLDGSTAYDHAHGTATIHTSNSDIMHAVEDRYLTDNLKLYSIYGYNSGMEFDIRLTTEEADAYLTLVETIRTRVAKEYGG